MAIDLTKVNVQQISGGLSSPAPALYSIYYSGAAADWKVSADVTAFCAAKGVNVGDGCIIRFETVATGEKNHNLGLFTGDASAITLEVATMVTLP